MTDLNGSRGMRLIAGNSNRPLSDAIGKYLDLTPVKADGAPFLRRRGFCRGAGKCARRGHVRDPVHQRAGQRQSDGAADHHRCAAPRQRPAHHRGDPLFRLCPPGPQSGSAHADLRQAGGQPDHRSRRQPRADGGSACRPDPGLLRYPHRQSVRHAGDREGHCRESRRQGSDGGVARRGRRGARPRLGQPPRHRSRHRRQAARKGRRCRK